MSHKHAKSRSTTLILHSTHQILSQFTIIFKIIQVFWLPTGFYMFTWSTDTQNASAFMKAAMAPNPDCFVMASAPARLPSGSVVWKTWPTDQNLEVANETMGINQTDVTIKQSKKILLGSCKELSMSHHVWPCLTILYYLTMSHLLHIFGQVVHHHINGKISTFQVICHLRGLKWWSSCRGVLLVLQHKDPAVESYCFYLFLGCGG